MNIKSYVKHNHFFILSDSGNEVFKHRNESNDVEYGQRNKTQAAHIRLLLINSQSIKLRVVGKKKMKYYENISMVSQIEWFCSIPNSYFVTYPLLTSGNELNSCEVSSLVAFDSLLGGQYTFPSVE